MAAPVWVLSVDLQTKTATFQSGMADAAKSARGAFTEIKNGSADMGSSVGGHMFEARHGVMLLGEEFGVRLPRALTAFITSIGPVGAAMEAAFPFLAIAVGATLLVQHLMEVQAAGVKLTQDQVRFGTTVQETYNLLDQKMLAAEIRSDELRNDHLGALHHQLQLIDSQSMAELIHQFNELAKDSDAVFAGLKTKWYEAVAGSDGAKRSLDDFQTQYAAMNAAKDYDGASKLLHDKVARERELLALQKEVAAYSAKSPDDTGAEEARAAQEASLKLGALKMTAAPKEIAAQEELLRILNAQLGVEQRIRDTAQQDGTNAKLSDSKQQAGIRSQGAQAAAEHSAKMAEMAVTAERQQSDAVMTIRQAGIMERLEADVHFADEEYRIQLDTNARLIQALNSFSPDYNNQLAALHQKAEELTRQHGNTLAELGSKASVAMFQQDVQNVEAGERAKIEATQEGTVARLAAIDAAIKEEQSKNLEATGHYRDLLAQRVQAERESTAESNKLAAEAGKEAADNENKMGELLLAAERQREALRDSATHMSVQKRQDEAVAAANDEYALKMRTFKQDEAALDKGASDYQNKLRAIQDKELQLIREHENQLAAIKDQATIEQNQKQEAALTHLEQITASSLTQVLMGHKSFASMMNSIGNEVVSGMMQTALMSAMTADFGKEKQAAQAARDMYLAGAKFPFPANIVAAPVMAAAAFASVMAFEGGTDMVPGVGKGDTTPAMLTPGEGVVPGGVMDNLRKMASAGTMGGGTHYHAHVNFAPNLQALDASGIDKVLKKHGTAIQKHIGNELRRMNK